MSHYFLNPYERSGENVKAELDLSNYATKAGLKAALGVHTSKLAAKSDLAYLKAQVDKRDSDNLKTVPAGLDKLINIVDNDIKKNCMIILVTKVNAIDTKVPGTHGLVSKTQMI